MEVAYLEKADIAMECQTRVGWIFHQSVISWHRNSGARKAEGIGQDRQATGTGQGHQAQEIGLGHQAPGIDPAM